MILVTYIYLSLLNILSLSVKMKTVLIETAPLGSNVFKSSPGGGADYQGYVDDCSNIYYYYDSVESLPCTSATPTTTSTSTTTATSTGDCPSGWTQLSTGCYLYKEDPMTWAESKAFCEDLGAKMVVVESELEKDEITNMVADGKLCSVWSRCAAKRDVGYSFNPFCKK